jgi:GMP synthase-like glutamine amidotransferase
MERGEAVPPLEGFGTVVMLGGPMAVYERSSYPHLRSGARVLREAIGSGRKVLGVCLGAQMLAHVLGARVYRGHGEEAGWMDIELTEEGASDPVLGPMAEGGRSVRVLQWHGDTFEIPEGAVRLAGSDLYMDQAFRYGEGIYALQFHIECTKETVSEWFRGRAELPAILRETDEIYESYRRKAMGFYERFFAPKAASVTN